MTKLFTTVLLLLISISVFAQKKNELRAIYGYSFNNSGDMVGTTPTFEYSRTLRPKLFLNLIIGSENYELVNNTYSDKNSGHVYVSSRQARVFGARINTPLFTKGNSQLQFGVGAKYKKGEDVYVGAHVPLASPNETGVIGYIDDYSSTFSTVEPGFIFRYFYKTNDSLKLHCEVGADGNVEDSFGTYFIGIGFSVSY